MVYYYVIEIQSYQDGTSAYLVHPVSNANGQIALNQAESKYHQVLAAAAISELPIHSAVLLDVFGHPIKHEYYEHEVAQQGE